jgi:hypothetical protein
VPPAREWSMGALFDDISRVLASEMPRRRALWVIAGSLAEAALLACSGQPTAPSSSPDRDQADDCDCGPGFECCPPGPNLCCPTGKCCKDRCCGPDSHCCFGQNRCCLVDQKCCGDACCGPDSDCCNEDTNLCCLSADKCCIDTCCPQSNECCVSSAGVFFCALPPCPRC